MKPSTPASRLSPLPGASHHHHLTPSLQATWFHLLSIILQISAFQEPPTSSRFPLKLSNINCFPFITHQLINRVIMSVWLMWGSPTRLWVFWGQGLYLVLFLNMYNILIWYMYTLWNDYHKQVNTLPHIVTIFLCMIKIKTFSLSKLQIYSTNSIINYSHHVYTYVQNLVNLQLKVCILWQISTSPHLLHLPAFGKCCSTFISSTYNWDRTVFAFLFLMYSM